MHPSRPRCLARTQRAACTRPQPAVAALEAPTLSQACRAGPQGASTTSTNSPSWRECGRGAGCGGARWASTWLSGASGACPPDHRPGSPPHRRRLLGALQPPASAPPTAAAPHGSRAHRRPPGGTGQGRRVGRPAPLGCGRTIIIRAAASGRSRSWWRACPSRRHPGAVIQPGPPRLPTSITTSCMLAFVRPGSLAHTGDTSSTRPL